MGSHLLLLVVFSLFVSVVFSALMQDNLREQLRFGAMMFAGLVFSAVILGWLMFPFPL
jgi:hypothetical protein